MGDSVESESGTIDRSLASYALKNLVYRRDAAPCCPSAINKLAPSHSTAIRGEGGEEKVCSAKSGEIRSNRDDAMLSRF
jgi:hypothetical protein